MTDRWCRTDLTRWLEGLVLVSETWLQPLLAELGLPPSIVREPDLARRICLEAVESDALAPPMEDRQIRLFVLGTLDALAAAYTRAEANALQAWVETNLVSRSRPIGLLLWRRLLVRICSAPLISAPPDAWRSVLPSICDCLDESGVDRLDAALRERAPAATQDDEELGLDVPQEVLMAGEVARNDRTAAALRILAEQAGDAPIEVLIAWVAAQAEALGLDIDAFDARLFLHLDDPAPDDPAPLRLA